MGVGGAAAKAVQYTSGGRTHTYRGPADATQSTRCDTALSACSVCGLTPAERQMWHGKLMGPVVNLVKVNVGGGILAIPLTFRLCGAVPATAMLIFFAAMSHYSSTLLARVAEMTSTRTLEAAAQRLLGPRGGLVLQISMLLKCFGSLVAYLIVMGNVFPDLLCNHLFQQEATAIDSTRRSLGPHDGTSLAEKVAAKGAGAAPPSLEGDCLIFGLDARTMALLAIVGSVLMPLSLLRTVNSLRFGSALCLIMVGCLILLMIENAITHPFQVAQLVLADGTAGGDADTSGWFHGLAVDDQVEAVLRSLGILVFAFTSQHLVFPIYAELETPDGQRGGSSVFSLVSRLTYIAVCTTYWLMGASGFVSFGPVVRADVLQNLGSEPGGGSAAITLLKIGFVRPDPAFAPFVVGLRAQELTATGSDVWAQVSTLVFSYQFNIFAARPSLDALLFEPSASGGGDDGTKFVLEGWALVLFSAVLALVVPDLVRTTH